MNKSQHTVLPVAMSNYGFTKSYSGGSGTPTDPYLIANKRDLKMLCESSFHWSLHFRQIADIAFTSFDFANGGDFYNAGKGFSSIGNSTVHFTGSYNGDGYSIDGLKINRPHQDEVGFFGIVGVIGTLQNVGVKNINNRGQVAVGGLAGKNYGTISYCYSTGVVCGRNNAGGLVGGNYGTISQCYSTSAVSGDYEVGGLVGYHSAGTIRNCYCTGAVGGFEAVGGLVGFSEAGIGYCYSTGAVSGFFAVGGLLGYGFGCSAVSYCFWDMQRSEQVASDGGMGLPTARLQVQATFADAGWELAGEHAAGMDGIWKMGGDNKHAYPVLGWQDAIQCLQWVA